MEEVQVPVWVGEVEGLDDHPLSGVLGDFDCRNNRLADLALDQDGFADQVATVRDRVGPERVGVFLGTSTSGIRHTELCYRQHFAQGGKGLDAALRFSFTHAYFSLAAFARRRLGLRGPAVVISTACSSAAKTFAAAHRALAVGLCDAALVGGADTLCATTLLGFHALGLLSGSPCAPWSKTRRGISIGEGAAFALMDLQAPRSGEPVLLGYGESSDAHHMTAPHPEGEGAVHAMREALRRAGLAPEAIDYINLHGTGTPANDLAEDRGVTAVFGADVAASATKGWTGHTLGASGAIEAVIALICMRHGLLPGTLNTTEIDPDLALSVILRTEQRPIHRAMSNSFGFGGNNCSLIFGDQ
jgi:3-oxoacyl-[acyl-carrier-protein] synthase-1